MSYLDSTTDLGFTFTVHDDAPYHHRLPVTSTFPLAKCTWLPVRDADGEYVTALVPPATAAITDIVDSLTEQGLDLETAEDYALRYVR